MPSAAPFGSPVSHDVSAGQIAIAMATMPSSTGMGTASAAAGGLVGGAPMLGAPGLSFGAGATIVAAGSPNVVVNGRPAGRVTDPVSCHAGAAVLVGSSAVFINGLPAARVGDVATDGARIIAGSPNVIIGGGNQTAPDFAGIDAAAQIAALLAAAKDGKPFCAECQARAAAGH